VDVWLLFEGTKKCDGLGIIGTGTCQLKGIHYGGLDMLNTRMMQTGSSIV